MPLVLQVLSHKQFRNFDLMTALDKRITKLFKFFPWKTWKAIQMLSGLSQNHKCESLGGTTVKVRGSPESLAFILRARWISVP